MSYGYGYGRSTRPSDLGIAALLAVLLIGALAWRPVANEYKEWKHERVAASQFEERLALQHRLTRSEHRVEGNAPVVVAGKVYLTTPKQPWFSKCSFRCAVAVKDGSGYKVTLPVGFTYQPGEYQRNDPERFDTHHITELTYWSPKEHRVVTIKAEAGADIALPEELLVRKVGDMKVGEHGFIDGTSTLETSPGAGIVYSFQPVVSEPGDLMFGNGEMSVPITRTEEGFDVCLPAGGNLIYTPDQKPDGKKLLPARLDNDC
jgi:hypothetical protein